MDTLITWEAWQRAQGLSARTITERTATVRHLLEHAQTDACGLEPPHIIAYLGRPMKPATRATYHASIRAFCAWMQRTGVRRDNPADETPRPRRPKSSPRPLSPEHIAAMLAVANRRRTRTYILLGALAGLRIHEIAKVHGADIDPYSHALTVLGKGGKVAQVPLHDALIDEARHYPRDAYWFPAYGAQRDAAHVSEHAVAAAIRGTMLRAGFEGTPHQLRHSYGTALVREGVHLRVVQALMRHESPASTAIYTRVDEDQLRDGIAALRMPGLSIAA
jgi:integrase/recombinase XerD